MLVQTDNGAYNLLEVVSRLFSVMPIVCFKVFFHFVLLAVEQSDVNVRMKDAASCVIGKKKKKKEKKKIRFFSKYIWKT